MIFCAAPGGERERAGATGVTCSVCYGNSGLGIAPICSECDGWRTRVLSIRRGGERERRTGETRLSSWMLCHALRHSALCYSSCWLHLLRVRTPENSAMPRPSDLSDLPVLGCTFAGFHILVPTTQKHVARCLQVIAVGECEGGRSLEGPMLGTCGGAGLSLCLKAGLCLRICCLQ